MRRKALAWILTLCMLICTVPAMAFADTGSSDTLPQAEVTKLDAMKLKAGEYNVWGGGSSLSSGTEDLPLDIAVNFKALESEEEVQASLYKDYITDFYLTIDGLAGNSITADKCYLAGNYGTFGWIVIPTDGKVLEKGVEYPIVTQYDASLKYKDICTSVKDFTAAIHIDQAILDANPDMTVTLNLKMTNPDDKSEVLTIGDPLVYNFADKNLPQAEVTKLDAMTLTAEEHEYQIWGGGNNLSAGTEDMPLDVVVNFKALESAEDVLTSPYKNYITDFYLSVDGLEGDSIIADDCYLAGNYGAFGWIVIPTDGVELKEGEEYPIVTQYDATLNYKDICTSVKDFTAAIHINKEIIKNNPDIKVKLTLKMTNPEDKTDVLTVGEPLVYTFEDFRLPKAEVTKLDAMTLTAEEHKYRVWGGGSNLSYGTDDMPLDVVVNFKALESAEDVLTSPYKNYITDFYLSVDGLEGDSITANDCYLAGDYGNFGWIVIPTDGVVLEEGVEYPIVTQYDATLNYKDICTSVKDFTAAIHINKEIVNANPNMTVTLTLKMTNPNNKSDVLTIGEPLVYGFKDFRMPQAKITKLDAMTLTPGEHEYQIWGGGQSLTPGTVEKPLDIVVNFKALESAEDVLTSPYKNYITDFYLSVDGLEGDSITANDCYLAGDYGNFGWIVIPTDGVVLEEGVEYPIVTQYDATLNYKDICTSVKDFTSAIHISQAIADANPDMTVTLTLKMTNPKDPSDILIIDEPLVFDIVDLKYPEAVAVNVNDKVYYDDVAEGLLEADADETVKLLRNVEIPKAHVMVPADVNFDLNGYKLTAGYFSSFGNTIDNSGDNSGVLTVPVKRIFMQSRNGQLPVKNTEGYKFYELSKFNTLIKEEGTKFVFQPLVETASHEILLLGNAVTGVTVNVDVSWEQANGMRSQEFLFNDALVTGFIKSYNSGTGKYGKQFALTLKGTDSIEKLTYKAIVKSDTGVEFSAVGVEQ